MCWWTRKLNDSKEIEKIYDANKKIELFHELKVNPPISGHIAKRLINNSKRALKIISKYDTECEKDLVEGIKKMEDELAEDNKIRPWTYNMEVRNYIHIAIDWVNRWELK